jgi:hypothetical protein
MARGRNTTVRLAGRLHCTGPMQTRLILTILLAAQLVDAMTFTFGIGIHGAGIESNGIAKAIYGWAGLDGVLLAKGAVILITLGVLAWSASRFPRLLVWGSAAATSIGLLGGLTNVVSLSLLA